MLAGKSLFAPAAAFVCPDDFVQEAGLAEFPVTHQPGLGCHTPVQVKIEHAGLVQERFRDRDHPSQQAQVLFLAGIPVVIGRIVRRGRARLPALFAIGPAAHKLFAGHKGRIHIHALRLAGQRADLIRQFHHAAADQQVFTVPEYFTIHFDLFRHETHPLPTTTSLYH